MREWSEGEIPACAGMTKGEREWSGRVREWCEGEIPAYAGMTWVGAGMTWVRESRCLARARVN